jgi:hypothetical protein
MTIKEKLKEKKEKLTNFIETHDEEIGNGIIIACAGIWVTTMAYGIGRYRCAKYATGLMYLAKEAGIMNFDSWEFLEFIRNHSQKEVFKDWKRIREMN